jgi:hypothetical protein
MMTLEDQIGSFTGSELALQSEMLSECERVLAFIWVKNSPYSQHANQRIQRPNKELAIWEIDLKFG